MSCDCLTARRDSGAAFCSRRQGSVAVNLWEIRYSNEVGSVSSKDESSNSIHIEIQLHGQTASLIDHKDPGEEGCSTDVQSRDEIAQALSATNQQMACRDHLYCHPSNFLFAHTLGMCRLRLRMTTVPAPNIWNPIPNFCLYHESDWPAVWQPETTARKLRLLLSPTKSSRTRIASGKPSPTSSHSRYSG